MAITGRRCRCGQALVRKPHRREVAAKIKGLTIRVDGRHLIQDGHVFACPTHGVQRTAYRRTA